MKSVLAFALMAMALILPNAYATSSSVTINDKTYNVTYEATGLTVDEIDADTASMTLSLLVTSTDVAGSLQISLDRSFFDSKTNDGSDDDFFIVLDGGTEGTFTEEKIDSTRTLTIQVPSGTSSIDIIGTVFGAGEPAGTPTAEPPAETPTQEPPAETPTVEPTTQCGPGTVLKDGQCVLDETCGPGTILKDGQCVLDESSTPTTTSIPAGQGTQFLIGIIGAFIIAFVIMMILWAIGKAGSRKKN